jgi:hypothetical protein
MLCLLCFFLEMLSQVHRMVSRLLEHQRAHTTATTSHNSIYTPATTAIRGLDGTQQLATRFGPASSQSSAANRFSTTNENSELVSSNYVPTNEKTGAIVGSFPPTNEVYSSSDRSLEWSKSVIGDKSQVKYSFSFIFIFFFVSSC